MRTYCCYKSQSDFNTRSEHFAHNVSLKKSASVTAPASYQVLKTITISKTSAPVISKEDILRAWDHTRMGGAVHFDKPTNLIHNPNSEPIYKCWGALY